LVCDRLWLVADGACKPFEGDLDAYAGLLMEQRRLARREVRAAKDGDSVAGIDKKELRRERARRREETAALRKSVVDAERRMEKLTQEIAVLEARMADPEIYNGPTSKLMDLQVAHKKVKDTLAETEQQWLSAQEAIDGALDEAS
ncbi:MAG: ABC transporter ATP-binding protein, partial [Rhodospirillales bacterium]